jgi:hypothetical protein
MGPRGQRDYVTALLVARRGTLAKAAAVGGGGTPTQITYVNGAAVGTQGAASIAPSAGTVAVGDVAYVFWAFNQATAPTTDPPSGWTTLASVTGTGATNPGTKVFRQVYTSAVTASVTLTLPGSARQAACLVVYRGLNTTTPEDVTIASDNTHAAQTTHNPPPVTPATTGACILTAILERTSSGDTAWTAPSGYAKRGDTGTQGTGTAGDIAAVADLLTQQTAGVAVQPGDWTGNASISQIVTYTLALRPIVT